MSKILDDPRIDAGIESYPLAELPEGFIERTMGQVKKARVDALFQIRFNDLAIPVFLVVFSLTLAGLGLWLYKTIDPMWVEFIKLKFAYYQLCLLPRIGIQGINLIVYMAVFLVVMGGIWFISNPRRITGKYI